MASLLMIAFSMIIPCVSAKAETMRDVLREEASDTFTDTYALPPGSLYTQVKTTITLTTEYNGQYHLVLDAKGNLHVNIKLFLQMNMEGEAWFWDDTLKEWVSGQVGSQTSRRIILYNDLIVDSETQTSKQLSLSKEEYSIAGINPDNGELIALKSEITRHFMFKMVNGELQFEHSWEIVKGAQRLPI